MRGFLVSVWTEMKDFSDSYYSTVSNERGYRAEIHN